MLTNLWENLFGGGCYTLISEWFKTYSIENSAKLVEMEDVVIGTDNEQKLGRTYVSSINSSIATSVISVIVAFVLNANKFFQYIRKGRSSFWRYAEREFSDEEKKEVLEKALYGREKGDSPVIIQ